MSKIAEQVYDCIKEAFPLINIERELYIQYKSARLFFDFYIKNFKVLVEVQGRQHTSYVKHFHQDKEAFQLQKYRDNLKLEYVQRNDELSLVRFHYNEEITKELILDKIYKALDSDDGFCD